MLKHNLPYLQGQDPKTTRIKLSQFDDRAAMEIPFCHIRGWGVTGATFFLELGKENYSKSSLFGLFRPARISQHPFQSTYYQTALRSQYLMHTQCMNYVWIPNFGHLVRLVCRQKCILDMSYYIIYTYILYITAYQLLLGVMF